MEYDEPTFGGKTFRVVQHQNYHRWLKKRIVARCNNTPTHKDPNRSIATKQWHAATIQMIWLRWRYAPQRQNSETREDVGAHSAWNSS
eukprot:scaffold421308_cov64-Attheya_sp.AAC.1